MLMKLIALRSQACRYIAAETQHDDTVVSERNLLRC